jgi:hypothetical protein
MVTKPCTYSTAAEPAQSSLDLFFYQYSSSEKRTITIKLHALVTLTLVRACRGRWIGGWMGPRAVMDMMAKRKERKNTLAGDQTLAIQSVAHNSITIRHVLSELLKFYIMVT